MAGIEAGTSDCLAGAKSIKPHKLFAECRHTSRSFLCAHPNLTCDTLRSSSPTLSNQGLSTRGGTRTRNLLLRGEAPYPLGHTSTFDHGLVPTGCYHSRQAAQRTAGPGQHPQGMAGGHTIGGPHGQMTGRAYNHTAHTPGVANTDADASACARACEETRGQIPRIHPLARTHTRSVRLDTTGHAHTRLRLPVSRRLTRRSVKRCHSGLKACRQIP